MSKRVKITFTGDIMCDNNEILSHINYSNFFDENIVSMLNKADYAIGNLETPIVKEVKANKERYSFSAPIEFATYLKNSGFDLVTTANNHCLDCKLEGLIENIDNLDKIGLEHIGTYANKEKSEEIFIKNIEGLNIAFLSYTYGTNAFINNIYLSNENEFHVDLLKKQEFSNKILRKIKDKFFENIYFYSYKRDKYFLEKLENKIKKAKEKADIVVLCLHSGGQYNKKVDYYTNKLCKYLSNLGVDIIIGNHSHVILNAKKINNTLAFYSLGNFFACPFSNHNQKDDYPDFSIVLNVILDAELKAVSEISYSIVKTIMNKSPKNYNIYDIYQKSNLEEKKHIEKVVKKINTILNNTDYSIKQEYKLNTNLGRN